MRKPSHVLKSLEEQSQKDKEYKFDRLYRNLYNPDFYMEAYKNIAKSQGSMTVGADGMTLNDMTEARVNRIIASLKDQSYQPNPARREYIQKQNSNKKRPLGIMSTDDKLVQEAIRMILEAIYEPTFSSSSHGFRPKRSCHTALQDIQFKFKGAKWIIEGDIKACFDSFDHHVLIDILRRKINDEHFISLMWKFLRAGYMEQWVYFDSFSGTPQGSGMSPILANVYLSELDNFIENYKAEYNTVKRHRRVSKKYKNVHYKFTKLKVSLRKLDESADRRTAIKDFKSAQKELLQTPCYPAFDNDFKRLQYNRYADDFVIGVIGSKADAQRVKEDIRTFLCDKLKLTLSEEKTKITHSGEMVRYLGYDFTVSRSTDTRRDDEGVMRRYWYGSVVLYLPYAKWFAKLQEYKAVKIIKDKSTGKEKWKSLHRGSLMNKTEYEIISKYNAETRGLYNYYWLAENVSVLNNFHFIMEGSFVKTLAAKYNTSSAKIRASYTKNGLLGINNPYKAGHRVEYYNEGFSKKDTPLFGDVDLPQNYKKYSSRNSLAARLRAGICELCKCKTDEIHMHHVRRLKDLTGKNDIELLMLKKRRKSLALCPYCFDKTCD